MRPRLHFTAPTGWINDPHGITVHDGEYHSFYQYVPGSVTWSPACRWGHAKGADLLSLTELPVALEPGDGDIGIWTGALVQDGADARIFYTTVAEPDLDLGGIRVATPTDSDWITWEKGPVVVVAPEGLGVTDYRDPVVRRDPDAWRMFVGASLNCETAVVLSYTSQDLDAWDYEGIVMQRSTTETDPIWTGAMWECPQVFTEGDRAAMVTSVWERIVAHHAAYAVGTYEPGRFDAEHWARLGYGDSLYAPSLFTDADGEQCAIFWLRGVTDPEAGWAGAHSIPYRLRITQDAVVAEPHPDVARHRVAECPDGHVSGLEADVEWDAEAGELTVTSGGEALLRVRRDGSSAEVEAGGETTTVPVAGGMRIILDGPIVELSSAGGLFAAAVSPRGDDLAVTATAGSPRTFRLA